MQIVRPVLAVVVLVVVMCIIFYPLVLIGAPREFAAVMALVLGIFFSVRVFNARGSESD